MNQLSRVEEKARAILIQRVAQQKSIPFEAAEDLIEHIQELIYERLAGMSEYTSDEEILEDFGIDPDILWVFD